MSTFSGMSIFGVPMEVVSWIALGAIGLAFAFMYHPLEQFGKGDTAKAEHMMEYIQKYKYRNMITVVHSFKTEPHGLVIGKGFIAYVWAEPANQFDDKLSHVGYIFRWVNHDPPVEKPEGDKKDPNLVDVLIMTEPYMNSHFELSRSGFKIRQPLPVDVDRIVTDIVRQANNVDQTKYTRNFTALLTGVPGSGKSLVADALAHRLKCPVLKGWTPFTEGHVLQSILKETACHKELVIVFNELDGSILEALRRPVRPPTHRHLRPPIWNKQTVCDFLDEIQNQSDLFVVITMNCDPRVIDEIDPAILRTGRINGRYVLTTPIGEQYAKDKYTPKPASKSEGKQECKVADFLDIV